MHVLSGLGHLFFRTRNALFPALLVTVCLLFPPAALDATSRLWLVAGGLLLAMGQGLRVLTIGLDYIQRGGRHGRIHADGLVTGGVFALCRNPMYTGNVLMVIGFFLIAANPLAAAIGSLVGLFVYRAIVAAEEGFLRERFGASYAAYCRATPRWLPAPSGLMRVAAGHRFDWAAVVIREYGTLFTTVLISAVLIALRARAAGTWSALAPALLGVVVLAFIGWATARYLKKSRRLVAQRGRRAEA